MCAAIIMADPVFSFQRLFANHHWQLPYEFDVFELKDPLMKISHEFAESNV